MPDSTRDFTSIAVAGLEVALIAVVSTVLVAYAIAIGGYVFHCKALFSLVSPWFDQSPIETIGIPVAGVAAFAIVWVLWKRFPPAVETAKTGDASTVSIKVLGLEMTGPSGPISLWVVCFLAIVAAMAVLRKAI